MSTSRVHRVRFYNVEPKAIHCMAYARECRKLALSRADSSVEVWNLRNTAFLERVLPGRGSVESLAWCGDRLFSTGLNARVVEHDLKTLTIKHSANVTAGPAWCLGVNRQKTCLAVGTEDGYINIFSIEHDNMMYEKILDKQEGRILCLSWDSSGDFIATGSVDAVRIWNVHTGHALHKMTTGRDQAKKETIVWCIAITDDFTVISGDSRGKISFWNGHTGMNTETYQSHQADILCLALSDDQSTVYCSGVDPLIATFTRISISSASVQNGISGAIGAPKATSKRTQWCRSANRRIHVHDVRAIAVCHENLCSGGIDTYLAVSWPPKVLVKCPPIPQAPCVMVCPESRSLLLRYTSSLEVWRLGDTDNAIKNGPQSRGKKQPKALPMNGNDSERSSVKSEQIVQNPVKILELKSRHDEHITCCALSSDSKWLAYSTESLIRIFYVNDSEENTPHLDKVGELPAECVPAHLLKFSPDSSSLALVSQEGQILIFELNLQDQAPVVAYATALVSSTGFKDTIHLLEISRDGQYIIAGDLQGSIAVWKEKKFYCSLPKYSCAPSALNISPQSNVVVAYADNKIVEYSLHRKEFTAFSRKLDRSLPKQWQSRFNPVTNIAFDPREPKLIFLHDDSTICVIDKNKDVVPDAKIPRLDSALDTEDADERRAHPGVSSPEHAFHVIKRYKHLVYFGWLAGDESVVVEVNPQRILKQLPPALFKKRYGV